MLASYLISDVHCTSGVVVIAVIMNFRHPTMETLTSNPLWMGREEEVGWAYELPWMATLADDDTHQMKMSQ